MSETVIGHAIVGCILIVMGIALFFGFYFGMVVPNKTNLDQHESTTCVISDVQTTVSDCSRKSNCQCPILNPCLTTPSCLQRESDHSNGVCCDAACCVTEVCQACTKLRCLGCPGKSQCCFYTDGCCSKVCTQWSSTTCLLEWGQCRAITFFYTQPLDSTVRSYAAQCGFNDQACVARQRRVNESFECWYDHGAQTVQFSKPSQSQYVGGWVGASFGLLMWLFAIASFCCAIFAWCGCDCLSQASSGSSPMLEAKMDQVLVADARSKDSDDHRGKPFDAPSNDDNTKDNTLNGTSAPTLDLEGEGEGEIEPGSRPQTDLARREVLSEPLIDP